MKKLIQPFLLVLFCAVILGFSLRGIAGNPTSTMLNQLSWRDDGPLELSPDRGRFALTYSLVEDKSFYFSLPIAKFIVPDLGYSNGKYVSLFAPGVSFLIIPGYLLGKIAGFAQVGAFATIAIFALINVLLLRAISIRLGANQLAATIGSMVFIFASPAFTYAVTLYQHHISTFLILLAIYTLIRWKNIWSLFLIWFSVAASIPVDYPNLFLMFPIAVYALGRFVILKREEGKLSINLKLAGFITFITAVLPILFFLWFNQISYGNPFQLSGTVPSVKAIDEHGLPTIPEQFKNLENAERFTHPELQQKTATGFFKTRNLMNGLYVHFMSPDRGIFWFAPIVLFGVFGMIYLYKKNPNITSLLIGVIGSNVILYSLWRDAWGGWAFGSRYLIPSYAILSIFIALLLTYWRRKTLFLVLFIFVAFYSIAVNTLGAVTSSRNPPQVEVLNLEKLSGAVQKYTYERNWDFLVAGKSKSFVYQTFLKDYLTPVQFYQILTVSICLVVGGIMFYYALIARRRGEKNV